MNTPLLYPGQPGYQYNRAEERDNKVVLTFINDNPDIDLEPFDKIVIGASIRYGTTDVMP